MDCYPDNSVARFTTKSNNAIELEGDWEVGLTEISFPSSTENVLEGHCYYTISVEDRFLRKITLDTKHYATIRDLVNEREATDVEWRRRFVCGFSCQTGKLE